MKILVFSTDVLPIPTLATSGTALRTHGLCEGLKHHGQEVKIYCPKMALEGLIKNNRARLNNDPELSSQVERLKTYSFDRSSQSSIVSKENPDVIICGHWPASMFRTRPSQVVIIDLAGPFLLERFFAGAKDLKDLVHAKLQALSFADYYLVSGPSQRRYFLSFLLRAGISQPEKRIRTLTMPLPPHEPKPSSHTDLRFVFGGVFLPWQDPSWALNKLVEWMSTRPDTKLTLVGGPHPNYPISNPEYSRLFARLEQSESVERKPLLPYEQFLDTLNDVNVAVDLMAWNLERQLAVPIRTCNYLWSGLPLIYNDYSDLARLVETYNAGWCVSPGDNEKLYSVLNEIGSSPDLVQVKARGASELSSKHFHWDSATRPILEIMEKPPMSARREIDVLVESQERSDFFVYGDRTFCQDFLCRIDGLLRIELRFNINAGKELAPLKATVFQLKLDSFRPSSKELERAKAIEVSSSTLDSNRLVGNEWIPFDFEPLGSSAGKVFRVELRASEAKHENSISPWTMRASPFPLLSMWYNSRAVAHHACCIRTACERNLNQ